MQLCVPFKAQLKSHKANIFAFTWIYVCVDEATRLPLVLGKMILFSIDINMAVNYLVIIHLIILNV